MVKAELIQLANIACEAWLEKLCDELDTEEWSLVETAVRIYGLRALSELTGRHGRERIRQECVGACRDLAEKLKRLRDEDGSNDRTGGVS